MAELTIDILDQRTHFAPGEVLSGVASWGMSEVNDVVLRLFWRTEGKGTQDVGLVERIEFEDPQPVDSRTFQITLPAGPHSYRGTLVSIVWALELDVSPGGHQTLTELTVRPA